MTRYLPVFENADAEHVPFRLLDVLVRAGRQARSAAAA